MRSELSQWEGKRERERERERMRRLYISVGGKKEERDYRYQWEGKEGIEEREG